MEWEAILGIQKEALRLKFKELSQAVKGNGGKFNKDERNPAKCASCIANLLCGHKTGQFEDYSIPYSLNYLKTYYAKFPEELRKDDEPQTNPE